MQLLIMKKAITLTNFQRCRAIEEDELVEITRDGKYCYLLEFTEGQELEILSQKVYLNM